MQKATGQRGEAQGRGGRKRLRDEEEGRKGSRNIWLRGEMKGRDRRLWKKGREWRHLRRWRLTGQRERPEACAAHRGRCTSLPPERSKKEPPSPLAVIPLSPLKELCQPLAAMLTHPQSWSLPGDQAQKETNESKALGQSQASRTDYLLG